MANFNPNNNFNLTGNLDAKPLILNNQNGSKTIIFKIAVNNNFKSKTQSGRQYTANHLETQMYVAPGQTETLTYFKTFAAGMYVNIQGRFESVQYQDAKSHRWIHATNLIAEQIHQIVRR